MTGQTVADSMSRDRDKKTMKGIRPSNMILCQLIYKANISVTTLIDYPL